MTINAKTLTIKIELDNQTMFHNTTRLVEEDGLVNGFDLKLMVEGQMNELMRFVREHEFPVVDKAPKAGGGKPSAKAVGRLPQ